MNSLEIDFFFGEVRVCGKRIPLPDKEMELLFTVAAAGPMNGDNLMDALWPEADGDAAHNAFRVCLHRLRKHLKSGEIIHRNGRAYALDPEITVDLYSLRVAVSSRQDEIVERCLADIRAGHASRASLGSWFEPFERLLWSYARHCRQSRASDLVTAP
jgi:DNA-binding SARP family transcriptional activator